MSLIKRKGIANVYSISEDISIYSPKKKEEIINKALKQKFIEKNACLLLNAYDVKQLDIKSQKIDAPIKWLYFEKLAVINSFLYKLKMCIRKENENYYVHNIYSLPLDRN